MTPGVWLALSAIHPIHNFKQPGIANALPFRRGVDFLKISAA